MEPDIFNPYIELDECCGAGLITIHGGGCVNDIEYKACGGSPYQSAYNEAFKLALAAQLPLWKRTGELLYHPDWASLKPKEESQQARDDG